MHTKVFESIKMITYGFLYIFFSILSFQNQMIILIIGIIISLTNDNMKSMHNIYNIIFIYIYLKKI